MRVFVTGGSGFIGGHIIELLSKEHSVLAMARSERSAEKVRSYGAEAVECDLGSISAGHMAECDVVVHSAAYVEEWGTRDQFWQANVEGTRKVLTAAQEAGVQRFIHIGTEAVLFNGQDLIGVDERTPYPERHRFYYSESKAEAERIVLAANTAALTTLSLRPRLVWGTRDTSVLPAVLRMINGGQWVWLDQGQHTTSTTHVGNLTHAVELALRGGRGGEAYFVADDQVISTRLFFERLLETQETSIPNRSLPGALARPLAYGLESVWRGLRIKSAPPMSGFAVAMMSRSITVNTAKAKSELGYAPPVSLTAGMEELSKWSSGCRD